MRKTGKKRPAGFTLLEIVLALGLAAMLLYLLTLATELTIFRVDRSRARVESAQVARVILERIAGDLQNARLDSPRPMLGGTSAGGTSTSGTTTTGLPQSGTDGTASGGFSSASGNTGGTSASGATLLDASTVRGIYGNEQMLRIDRSVTHDWHDVTKPLLEEEQDETVLAALPQTVFYTVEDGQRLSSPESAERGVRSENESGIAGLYRESLATSVVQAESASDGVSNYQRSENSKLLAPEVVSIEYGYFDGSDMLDAWDSVERAGLPRGVEIRLQILEVAYEEAIEKDSTRNEKYREEDLVEYRRYVNLAGIQPQQPLPMLLGQPRQTAGGFGGRGGGSAGDNSEGGGSTSGTQATGEASDE